MYDWKVFYNLKERLKGATDTFDSLVPSMISNKTKQQTNKQTNKQTHVKRKLWENYGKELVNFDKFVKALQAAQVAHDQIDTIKIALEALQ